MRLQSSCAPYCSLRNRLAWGLLEVDVPKSILDHDGLLAVDHPPGSFGVPSILHSVGNKIRIEAQGTTQSAYVSMNISVKFVLFMFLLQTLNL